MAERIRIAVVYGGQSSEHAVSVVSAGSVIAALDRSKYDVVTVGITAGGEWLTTELNPAEIGFAQPQLPSVAGSGVEVSILGKDSAVVELDSVDVVFPVLHGKNGEDGTIQGLLELAGVPYVGSGVLASSVSMDKAFTKTILTAAGLLVTPYVLARRGRPVRVLDVEHLGLPLFVKPARAGSSVGVSRVTSYDQLADALETAFSYDSKALIEAAMTGREIECGVLEDADGSLSASLPAEIRLRPGYDWYDFDAKYLDDATDFDIPPQVAPEQIAAVQAAACRTFEALECSGLARVDGFLAEDGQFVVNEVNTMPGFTPISMYPRMWAESGVAYPQLLDRLIATARARAAR
ncbi:MAG TPA: D-alanine--D-alanine ligase family protein [Jatrophihabitans sp.]|nr:D-alanine--D-alanine ligase family protein [Jatrophihabitans sp.]